MTVFLQRKHTNKAIRIQQNSVKDFSTGPYENSTYSIFLYIAEH